jgi:UDP-N-acetylglucosamine:LPS N-acetylglucosamine transferase
MISSFVILANGGTNGDVIPLFILIKRLIERNNNDYYYIIIKNIHEGLFYNTLNSWINNSDISKCKHNNRYELFQLTSSSISTTSSSSFYSMNDITNILTNISSKNKLSNNKIKTVFTNLFSLEGYIFSESINVKCIIIHPHIPKSSTSTTHLINMLKEDTLHLYNQFFLFNNNNNNSNNNNNNNNNDIWIFYKHFLWPILSDHYMELRVSLGLLPIDDVAYILPPIHLMPIIYISSLDILQINKNVNDNNMNDKMNDNKIYDKINDNIKQDSICQQDNNVSPHQMVGFIHDSLPNNIILPEYILNWIHLIKICAKYNILCIDFGSMTDIIAYQYDLTTICNIINELGLIYSIIIVCHNNLKFIEEFNSFQFDSNNNILVINDNVIHSLLFVHVALVIHHGGVGVIGICLKLSIPQIIVPILIKSDQYDNALAIQKGGLGSIITKDFLFPDEFIIDNIIIFKNFIMKIINEILNSNVIKYNVEVISVKLIKESDSGGINKIFQELNL